MTAWEYIAARDAALALTDPRERYLAYRRAKNQRHWSRIKADPERYRRTLEKVRDWKRRQKC